MRTARNSIFFILAALLGLLPFTAMCGFAFFAGMSLASALLGLMQLILTSRVDEPRSRKILFYISGAAAHGPLFGVLHNLPCFQHLWVWAGIQDEPVFFMLAVLICPVLYLLSAALSIGLMVWDHYTGKSNLAADQY